MDAASFLTVLPNLSIGVVAVLALAYLSLVHSRAQKETQEQFMKALDDRATKHESAMQEREEALRSVEREVRSTFSKHLLESTRALEENTKVLSRVVSKLDGQH